MPWAPDYATVAELAAFLRIADNQDDVHLAVAITAASRAIDATANRQFGKVAVPEPRLYTARWSGRRGVWVIPVDDLMTSAGLAVDVDSDGAGDYAPVTGYQLRPYNAAPVGRPWEVVTVDPANAALTGRAGAVRVTAAWGWSAVPVTVKSACLLQASRFFARREAPFGVAGSPDAGTEMRLLARVDPDVAVSLQPYRKVVLA